MDRFEELTNCMCKEMKENIDELKKVVQEIDNDVDVSNNTDKLIKLGEKIKWRNKQFKKVMLNEKSVREMLNGFFDNGEELFSLVYSPISHLNPNSFQYCVNGYRYEGGSLFERKLFKTLQEAKEYSISLGVDKDWLSNIMTNPQYYGYFDLYLSYANSAREEREYEKYKKEQAKEIER